MLKSIIVLVIFLTTFTGTASAQNLVSVESSVAHVSEELTFNMVVNKKLTKKWGVSSFFQVREEWAQACVGPTYSRGSYILGFSAGVFQTTDGLIPRYSMFFWKRFGKMSVLNIFEFDNSIFHGDDSDIWYDMNVSYQLSEWIKIGVKNRRFEGVGPMVQFEVVHGASIWATWMPLELESLEIQRVALFGAELAL